MLICMYMFYCLQHASDNDRYEGRCLRHLNVYIKKGTTMRSVVWCKKNKNNLYRKEKEINTVKCEHILNINNIVLTRAQQCLLWHITKPK